MKIDVSQLDPRTFILSRSWKAVLTGDDGKLTPPAIRVLADLKRFCEDSATAVGHYAPCDNETSLAYARRREVYQRILNCLHLDDSQMLQIEREDQ